MRFDEPLLSAADEVELARTIEAGVLARAILAGEPGVPSVPCTPAELEELVRRGEAARERFLLANCRLVMGVAHKEAIRLRLPADELFQEGFLGLVEALERFDHTRGNRFATVALVWVRSRVGAAARVRCGELHVPAWAVLRHGEQLSQPPLRLATDEHEIPLPDLSAQSAFDAVDEVGLGRLLADLPELEQAVLQARFGQGETSLLAVSRQLGMSRSTARRLQERGLARLRERMVAERAAESALAA